MRSARRACMGRSAVGGAGRAAGRLPRNGRFYRDGAEYLGHLRRLGRADDAFEDEMYYTMPAVSSPSEWPAPPGRGGL